MKKSLLFTLLIAGLLASCGEIECNHIDEDKNHLCDLCGTPLGEHKDNDNNHYCDYCGDQIDGCVDVDLDGKCDACGKDMILPYEYAEWPTKDVQDLVSAVSGSSVIVPAFLYADDIEIYEDELISRNMFGIFCYTENAESENQYKALLTENGFEVSDEKINHFYEAYDSNWEILINFEYNPEYSDLEIYVTCSDKMKWPENDIKNYLNDLAKGTKTTIPAFTAKSSRLNYQPAIAAFEMMGETLYAYLGTTLAYYATELMGVFQIEIMKLSEPAK